MINTNDLFDTIDSGRQGLNKGISTGIEKLDEYIGGIQKGIYYLIFSGSGGGKSSLALYSYIYRPLKDNPDKDIVLLYYSMEMSEKVLLTKLLGLYVYEEFGVVLSFKDIMSWQKPLSDENYNYLLKGKEWLNSISHKLIIYDKTLNRDSFYRQAMNLLEDNGNFIESKDGLRTIYKPNNPNKLIIGVVDHISLVVPKSGATRKEEMDAISSYAVRLREKCGFTWVFLQQENRNVSNMERRKAELLEPDSSDLKDSGCMYNDSNVCISIFNPLQLKLKVHDRYKIINEDDTNFHGLRDRYRALFIIKNREGEPNKKIPVNFFGEIGYWKTLPKAEEITDYMPYLYLKENFNKEEVKDEAVKPKKEIIYKF